MALMYLALYQQQIVNRKHGRHYDSIIVYIETRKTLSFYRQQRKLGQLVILPATYILPTTPGGTTIMLSAACILFYIANFGTTDIETVIVLAAVVAQY